MSAPEDERFEPWAWVAFALLAAIVCLFLYLGMRPGANAIRAYLFGPPLLGLAAALVFAFAFALAILRRPMLSRRRVFPFAALMGVVWLASFPFPYPSSHEGHPSAVAFRLPVDGTWRVRWGGDRRETNVLVLSPSRRFGLDLVGPGDREVLGDVVFAPAPGTVVAVQNDRPDGGLAAGAEPDPFGNHVVLEVAEGEYLVLGSLQEGSVEVAVGQAVDAGQPIARVGYSAASGVTPEPHLMVHLQDAAEPGRGEGIPMRFHDFSADGTPIPAGVPRGGGDSGQLVQNAASWAAAAGG